MSQCMDSSYWCGCRTGRPARQWCKYQRSDLQTSMLSERDCLPMCAQQGTLPYQTGTSVIKVPCSHPDGKWSLIGLKDCCLGESLGRFSMLESKCDELRRAESNIAITHNPNTTILFFVDKN